MTSSLLLNVCVRISEFLSLSLYTSLSYISVLILSVFFGSLLLPYMSFGMDFFQFLSLHNRYFTPCIFPMMTGLTGFSITSASICPVKYSPSIVTFAVGNNLVLPSISVHKVSLPVNADPSIKFLFTTQQVAPESYKHSASFPFSLTLCCVLTLFDLSKS